MMTSSIMVTDIFSTNVMIVVTIVIIIIIIIITIKIIIPHKSNV